MSGQDDSDFLQDDQRWERLVDKRYERYLQLREFVRQNIDEIEPGRLYHVIAAPRKVGAQAGGEELFIGWKIAKPPATAVWAAVLKQANHAFENSIREIAPHLAPLIPCDANKEDRGREFH